MFSGKPKGDLEAPPLGEHYHKHPMQPAAFGIDPSDGLPRPVANVTQGMTEAPFRTAQTFICMGDLTFFVIRSPTMRVLMAFEPSQVQRAPNGSWYLKKEEVDAEKYQQASELTCGVSNSSFVPVEPIRPQCEHYRRTLLDHPDDPERRKTERVCMAARDEGGQYVSLNDTRIYACELREPRHLESEGQLNVLDEKEAREAHEKTREFDVDEALAAEGSAGGIFDS